MVGMPEGTVSGTSSASLSERILLEQICDSGVPERGTTEDSPFASVNSVPSSAFTSRECPLDLPQAAEALTAHDDHGTPVPEDSSAHSESGRPSFQGHLDAADGVEEGAHSAVGRPKCQGHLNAANHVEEPDASEELPALEKELTREVPMLLESMNRASADVNALEHQVSEAQARYRQLLEHWSRLYEDMRSQHGQALENVRPYFDAAQALSIASHRAQGVVREFSAAASQHSQAKVALRAAEERIGQRAAALQRSARNSTRGVQQVTLDAEQQEALSRATVQVQRAQQARDKCEREYARVLKEYQESQVAVEGWRTEIGDAAIRRMVPVFRQLHQHQAELAAEQSRINTLLERARATKHTYHSSLHELDRINVAVHNVRESCGQRSSVTRQLLPGVDARHHSEDRCLLRNGRTAGSLGQPPNLSVQSRSWSVPPEVSPEQEHGPGVWLDGQMLPGSSEGGLTPSSCGREAFESEALEAFAFGEPETTMGSGKAQRKWPSRLLEPTDDGPFA